VPVNGVGRGAAQFPSTFATRSGGSDSMLRAGWLSSWGTCVCVCAPDRVGGATVALELLLWTVNSKIPSVSSEQPKFKGDGNPYTTTTHRIRI